MELDEYLFRNKITKTSFADKIGVHRNYLHQILRKERAPSPQLAIKIEKETNGAVTKEQLRPDIFH
jgi:DNA-binding transcriptional regulator YdaS (Cro superfamily)